MSLVAIAAIGITACERAAVVDPMSPDIGIQSVVVTPPLPVSTPYPAKQQPDQAIVCKDASSPAGSYTFSVSSSPTVGGDQTAHTATLSPGQCAIVYNRTTSSETFTSVTITETIPQGAAYRLNHVAVNDIDGPRDVAGPSVTLKVNQYHGALANYFNEPAAGPPASLPISTPYPAPQQVDKSIVCKDASSPQGSYTFNVSASGTLPGDQVAASATLQPGQCAIVYLRGTTSTSFTTVTTNEVIPQGASFRLNHVAVNDIDGPRNTPGPGVSLKVNSFHGSTANYFNEAAGVVTPPLVPLGAAGSFGILAGTTVTCVTGSTVGGDIGISPGSALTGFGPCTLSGSKQLATPVSAQAQLDLTIAYNLLAGLPCPPANLLTADLGGTTKPAGVYCSATGIALTGTLTLDGGGDINALFVFQAGSTFITAGNIVLINGAQAKNVFFQVGSSATLGTSSVIQGNILALTSITLNDNVTLIGRALARNGAVTLGTNDVITLP